MGRQTPIPAPMINRPISKIGKCLAKYIVVHPTKIHDCPMISVRFRPISSAILPPTNMKIITEISKLLTKRNTKSYFDVVSNMVLLSYLLNQDTSSSVISSESVVVFGFENATAAVGLNPNAVPIVKVLVNVITTA